MPPRQAGLTGFGSLSGLALVVVLATLLAWFASATPRALPAGAHPERFAAGRVMADISRLAAVPHPNGSSANAHVRDALVARLHALGLAPVIERAVGVTPFHAGSAPNPPQPGSTVENVVARLPGRNRAAPALLVMSHYDSVPRSPGAADDMAGVASELEIARLFKIGPPPLRDVVFLFTDGEEVGLLGAKTFFADPALSQNVSFVLNMDTRGGGGRALMFQTGRDAGGAMRLFAANARQPASNSLAALLYDETPNDTDFSVALARGLPGLNYAFIGRPGLYHTPAAIPPAVEPGAVQSLGEQAWAMARAVAMAPALPAKTASPTWFDLFGRVVVVYDPLLGWAPLLVAALLLGAAVHRAAKAGELAPADLVVGAGQTLAATLLAVAVLLLYGRIALGGPTGMAGYYGALARAAQTETACAAVILGSALLVFRAGPSPARPCGRWAGAAMLAWLIALLMQLLAPRTAFLAEWPSLAIAGAVLLGGRAGLGRWGAVLLCGLALGFLLEAWHALVLGVAVLSPAFAAVLAPLALPTLSPWLQRSARARAPGVVSALI